MKNIETFSAESADPSGLKKRGIVRRDNDIMPCILVYSEKTTTTQGYSFSHG